MDQHPIPQNVTGFQFKLIGSMTVKQFGYVAVGVIAAVIVYYLPIKGALGLLLKVLLIPFFGATGAIVAFLPIDGRPIDVMAGNFLKAIIAPNQYVYRKKPKTFSFLSIQTAKPQTSTQTSSMHTQTAEDQKGAQLQRLLMKSSMSKIKNSQDEHEAAFLKSIAAQSPTLTMTASPMPKKAPAPTLPPPLANTPSPVPTVPPVNKQADSKIIAEKEASLEKQIAFAKQEEAASHDATQVAILHKKTVDLESQLEAIRGQKQLLEQEIKSLKTQLAAQKTQVSISATPFAKSEPTKEPVQSAGHVRSVPKEMNKKMGLLVSDTANVVSGVVKDSRGNVLPNILVEIKDKSDNPVRAFKTNALGNFASATPLSDGTYTITLEDPKKQHTFDAIQITANNQVLLPIEIISYDEREQLRKDLFT